MNLHNRSFSHHDVGVVVLEGDIQLDTLVEEEEIIDTSLAQECLTEEGMLSRGLMKTKGCRILFGQLGLEGDVQIEAVRALVKVISRKGGDLYPTNAPSLNWPGHMQLRWLLENLVL